MEAELEMEDLWEEKSDAEADWEIAFEEGEERAIREMIDSWKEDDWE